MVRELVHLLGRKHAEINSELNLQGGHPPDQRGVRPPIGKAFGRRPQLDSQGLSGGPPNTRQGQASSSNLGGRPAMKALWASAKSGVVMQICWA